MSDSDSSDSDDRMDDCPTGIADSKSGDKTSHKRLGLLELLSGSAEDGAVGDSAAIQRLREIEQEAKERREADAKDGESNQGKIMCIECEQEEAVAKCIQCQDLFCRVCWKAQHRKGNRVRHVPELLGTGPLEVEEKSGGAAVPVGDVDEKDTVSVDRYGGGSRSYFSSYFSSYYGAPKKRVEYNFSKLRSKNREEVPTGDWWRERPPKGYFTHRAKFCPVRLPLNQRKFMRLIMATIQVNMYTDRVDIDFPTQAKRVYQQLKDVCAMLNGLIMGASYVEGQKLLEHGEFDLHSNFLQTLCELARRHKIRNPEKMREQYGKLIYLLQDGVRSEIQDLLDFKIVKPIKSVYTVLEKQGILELLEDPLVPLATGVIVTKGKERPEINKCLKMKEEARKILTKRYPAKSMNRDQVEQVILAIGDNHSYLLYNRDPCDTMLEYLTQRFKPDSFEEKYCLSIHQGDEGSRLTHSHEMQYYFVLQSLTLWRLIITDMYELWCLAEDDLLDDENTYELKDTGQGLQRVQQAPRVAKKMRNILHRAQKHAGQWVGSSVIHLGDNNVPNALMFIDKYNQVGRILLPIVTCLRLLPEVYEKTANIQHFVRNSYESLDDLIMTILTDFFKSAFDGSGADNFYAAGSCIDGRLTSAWNWCSQLHNKPYYPAFLMTGFVGFDGMF